MRVLGIIPARMASTRLPEKPLIDIGGISMIQRVYEQAIKSKVLDKVIVATDHPKIVEHVKRFGGNVQLTSKEHKNGTERCAELIEIIPSSFDVIINIQGDEPFINPSIIDTLATCFNDGEVEIATLAKPYSNRELIEKASIVKVVIDTTNKALYFSRSLIPFNREGKTVDYLKHIGIYAYRSKVLKEISMLEESSLEKIELLEQLRWLENGYLIKVAITEHESISIDTPEDLIEAEKFLSK